MAVFHNACLLLTVDVVAIPCDSETNPVSYRAGYPNSVLQVVIWVKMVRKLKFHEQKLLKKVDFLNWEVDNNLHEVKILRKYHIEKREDYTK